MGNHMVGSMFYVGVSTLSENEIDNLSQEKALEIIDKIGNAIVELTSLDAEFGDYLKPNQKLGKLVIKAFLPEKYEQWKNETYVNEEMDNDYYYKVYKPFKERFGFY